MFEKRGARRARIQRKKIILRSILGVGAVLIALLIYSVIRINSSIDDMGMNTTNTYLSEKNRQEIDTRQAARDEIVDETEEKPEDFYMLLIGLDVRGSDFTLNTDSLIVAHIIPQKDAIKLVSLPRDLRVENLSNQHVKVNSVFAEGYNHAVREARKDPSLLSGKRVKIGSFNVHEAYVASGSVVLRETIEKYLDIDIAHTFLVNFETVTTLVDKVGGIEIDVDRDMQYDDESDGTHIHLSKGLQTLNGTDALNFARFRMDNRGEKYWSSDFDRGLRQQKVIMALANELASWKNVTRIFSLLDIISSTFKTDMSKSDMFSLIRKFYDKLNKDSIYSIPFNAYWYYDREKDEGFSLIDDDDLATFKEEFTSIELPEQETPTE